MEKVDLNATERAIIRQYVTAREESKRDAEKADQAIRALISCIWVRSGGAEFQPFQLSPDGSSLSAIKEPNNGMAN